MSQRLKDHSKVLKKLCKSSPHMRISILKNADDELVRCLCECALNTIKNNVALTDRQFKKLSPHKKILRFLANKRIGLKTKKVKIIKQTGGFLLPLLVPILSSIIASMIK
jgi:hypothetical protein